MTFGRFGDLRLKNDPTQHSNAWLTGQSRVETASQEQRGLLRGQPGGGGSSHTLPGNTTQDSFSTKSSRRTQYTTPKHRLSTSAHTESLTEVQELTAVYSPPRDADFTGLRRSWASGGLKAAQVLPMCPQVCQRLKSRHSHFSIAPFLRHARCKGKLNDSLYLVRDGNPTLIKIFLSKGRGCAPDGALGAHTAGAQVRRAEREGEPGRGGCHGHGSARSPPPSPRGVLPAPAPGPASTRPRGLLLGGARGPGLLGRRGRARDSGPGLLGAAAPRLPRESAGAPAHPGPPMRRPRAEGPRAPTPPTPTPRPPGARSPAPATPAPRPAAPRPAPTARRRGHGAGRGLHPPASAAFPRPFPRAAPAPGGRPPPGAEPGPSSSSRCPAPGPGCPAAEAAAVLTQTASWECCSPLGPAREKKNVFQAPSPSPGPDSSIYSP